MPNLSFKVINNKKVNKKCIKQRFSVSLYNDALNTSISLDNNPYFHREDYELTDVEMKRHSILMDFDENNDGIRKFASIETMFSHDMDGRHVETIK